ncbi:energy transducer TonB [Qipengyuania sp. 1NDH17]|uniref:Energy transducer TonB n=1 Tax=Qipengyuania polymorpha TaxID=2867234 RepID=A0ABS7J172_9SPHN|nr:TonB family protein [Qipengyuania polymorpha]MBX7458065.1 energy transducer TonB [Qipengyuania polymorpha]
MIHKNFRKYLAAMMVAPIAMSAVSSWAQEADGPRGATPRDIQVWAGKIQQEYPSAALRNAEEGTVVMSIGIGTEGRVTSCQIEQTSGSQALDNAACSGMLRHAQYDPARNENGDTIATTMKQSIRYVLPDASSISPRPYDRAEPIDEEAWREKVFDSEFVAAIGKVGRGRAIYMLTLDENGKPTGCGMAYPSGDVALDRKTCAGLLEHARFTPAALLSGEAVPGIYPVFYPVQTLEPEG